MTSSKILFYFCLSFIGGIFLNSFLLGFLQGTRETLLLPGLILGLIFISVFWKYKNLVVCGFCILFLVLGILRYQSVESRINNNELRKLNDLDQNITLVGIIIDEPDIREKSIKLTVSTSNTKVLVTTWRYPEYRYGDKLKIVGLLETPPVFEGFNYQNYLKKDGIYSVMSFPKIELIGQGFGNSVMRILLSFKNKFKETARTFISPPQVGILEALIFGDEENISAAWKDKLNFTGVRHIAAVSGMNITIISALLLNLLLAFGFWRKQAFYFSVFLLILYILMIGFPASAVRAGIMGGLFMAAQYFGRLSAASRAIVFASTIMLFLNPLLLKFDVGFQLSFLAMMGMIFLQPAFLDFLKKIPNPKLFPLKTTLSATLSAQVLTLPVLIYNFGYIPLISPIVNILIVPFLAPITILIFIFGAFGIIFSPVGFILSWPTWLSLTYITEVIDIFSKIPFASLKLENISWSILVISYLILTPIIWRIQENQKLKFLRY